jgi:hypothetical protein
MTRLCNMFRLTVYRVHIQLVSDRRGHANQYGRRSCPTSGWLARLLTHISGGADSSVCVLGAGSGLHIHDPAAPT